MGDDETKLATNGRFSRSVIKAHRADAAQNCIERDRNRCMVDGRSCQDAIHGRRECPLRRMR